MAAECHANPGLQSTNIHVNRNYCKSIFIHILEANLNCLPIDRVPEEILTAARQSDDIGVVIREQDGYDPLISLHLSEGGGCTRSMMTFSNT